MSAHDLGSLLNFAIVAVVVIATIASRLRGVRGRFSDWAAKQQAAAQQFTATLQQPDARGAAAGRQSAAVQQVATALQAAAQQAAAQRAPANAPAYVPAPAYTSRPGQPSVQSSRRTVPPASMRSTDVPVFVSPSVRVPARALLGEAFADPAHARGAVILAEVLGTPVGLR